MNTLKTKFDLLVDKFQQEGKVSTIEGVQRDKIFEEVEKELLDYRFSNIRKVKDSQLELASFVLNA